LIKYIGKEYNRYMYKIHPIIEKFLGNDLLNSNVGEQRNEFKNYIDQKTSDGLSLYEIWVNCISLFDNILRKPWLDDEFNMNKKIFISFFNLLTQMNKIIKEIMNMKNNNINKKIEGDLRNDFINRILTFVVSYNEYYLQNNYTPSYIESINTFWASKLTEMNISPFHVLYYGSFLCYNDYIKIDNKIYRP